MYSELLFSVVFVTFSLINLLEAFGGIQGGKMGGSGVPGYLPPGYARIDGEVVDMGNKLVQRVGGMGGGSQYYSWANQKGPAIFRRREIDVGRRFIVFPDRNYPPGDGHYVVLRRFKHGQGTKRGGNIYEAFYLDLGDSINAMVTNFNSLPPASTYGGGLMMGRRGASGGGIRMKRKVKKEDEMVYLQKLHEFSKSETNDENAEDEEGFTSVEAEGLLLGLQDFFDFKQNETEQKSKTN